MRKLTIFAALLLVAVQAFAGNVDLRTACSKATDFMRAKAVNGRLMASNPTVKWVHEEKNSSNVALTAFYIVNTDKGYVIVSGDDRAKDVLAYGEGTLSSVNDLPEAVQYFLDIYQKQIEYLQAHPGLKPQTRSANRGISVEPLLKSAWSQGKPYNMKTPRKGYGADPYCKVGCAAVALAQVMYYWEFPVSSPALPGYVTETHGYVMDPLPEYTFDYENLLYTYRSNTDQYSDAVIDAISYLMLYTGYAMNMDYATDRSGAEYEEIDQAIHTFGFDPGYSIEMKWDYDSGFVNYTEEGWGELIQSELAAGRPLIYCAFDMASDSTGLGGGHAFNVDGYDADNDMYHVNFGMSAELNTYYALNAFTIDNGMTVYDFFPLLFAGVQPPGMYTGPRILVSPQELNVECYAGETTTATFNVVGEKLSEDITVALDDANGVFTVDATTIAVEDSAANVTVTVTYAPQAVGTHNATITLSSAGVEDKVVALKGVATNAPLVVYDPVMLPAAENYITLTSFRADWTDQTAAENVASYTLEVSQKPETPAGLLAEADWSDLPVMSGNQASHALDYLPEGWGFSGASMYIDEGGSISLSTDDYIVSPTLDLSGVDKITVFVRAKGYGGWRNSGFTVTTSVDSKTVELTNNNDYADYTLVLNCGESERVKIIADYYPYFQSIQIYAGEMEAPQLRAAKADSETYRLIEGITDKFCTVENLAEGGTFLYKVKALYVDGTESEWSNVEEVTLAGTGYQIGDVNHDGKVNISDVTALINILLTQSEAPIEANVNGDNTVNISDVTALINKLLTQNV